MNELEKKALLRDLVWKHYEEMEQTLRKFKWLAQVPQTGDEYIRNINVFNLQDLAVERLNKEKEEILNYIYNRK